MPSAIFTNHLPGHPCPSLEYLFFDPKGKMKLLSLTGRGLEIASELTHTQKNTHTKICQARLLVGDMKTIINVFNVPQEFPKLHFQYVKAIDEWRRLARRVRQKKVIKKEGLLQVLARTCIAVNSTLFVLGKLIFKPLKLVDRYCQMGEPVRSITKKWKVISIIKNGFKIGTLSSQLSMGCKTPLKKIICLILALTKVVLQGLKVCRVYIPKCVPLMITVAKAIFDIYKIHQKAN